MLRVALRWLVLAEVTLILIAMAVTIHADFDGGSLAGYQIAGDEVTLRHVPYTFNDQATGNWWYCRVDGAAGRRLTFRFDTTACRLHGFAAGNRMQLSYDQIEWQAINEVHGVGYEYSFSVEIVADRCWLALTAPYPMAQLHRQVAHWLQHSCVQPAPSANGRGEYMNPDGQAWRTAAGLISTTGVAIPPQPLYALSIHDPSLRPDAPTIIVVGGNHAGEHLCNYVIDGLVDWWLSDEPQADDLRCNWRLLLYPMINPAGRWGGYVRGTPTFPHGDHNRMWAPDDSEQYESIAATKRAIASDTTGPVLFFLDVHQQELPQRQYMYVNEHIQHWPGTKRLLPLLQRMSTDIPFFDLNLTTSQIVEPNNTTCKSWGLAASDGPLATYSYTMEPGSIPDQQIEHCRQYGRTIGRGLADHLQESTNT